MPICNQEKLKRVVQMVILWEEIALLDFTVASINYHDQFVDRTNCWANGKAMHKEWK